ncbi:Dyp-type peroxidase [Klebsiella pneumoniae]|nr:Dyp-type peroxidase [Klebsiella pneumoniae]
MKPIVSWDVDALRAASKIFVDKLATFQAKFPEAHLGAVVPFWQYRLASAERRRRAQKSRKDFIPVYGKGLAPANQYDVLIHIPSCAS